MQGRAEPPLSRAESSRPLSRAGPNLPLSQLCLPLAEGPVSQLGLPLAEPPLSRAEPSRAAPLTEPRLAEQSPFAYRRASLYPRRAGQAEPNGAGPARAVSSRSDPSRAVGASRPLAEQIRAETSFSRSDPNRAAH